MHIILIYEKLLQSFTSSHTQKSPVAIHEHLLSFIRLKSILTSKKLQRELFNTRLRIFFLSWFFSVGQVSLFEVKSVQQCAQFEDANFTRINKS